MEESLGFKFVFTADAAGIMNNVYVDDINISNNGVGLKDVFESTLAYNVFPNPNNGNFVIKVADFKTSATAILIDFQGNQIETLTLQQGDNKIEKETLKKGTYFITLFVDGVKETRQIVIK